VKRKFKTTDFFKIDSSNIINVFTDKFNASLLNESINFLFKNKTLLNLKF